MSPRPVRRNILITGASSGIGEGLAREFARRGRNLALCARRVDRLERLRDELLGRHPGLNVQVRALDVTDADAVFETFRACREALGSLDRVIVNAGVGEGRRIGTGRAALNLRTAQVNFVGGMAQCEAAVEAFRAQGAGHLVVIASMSALRGMPRHLTSYAASKAGLATLAEGIRAELLRTPIRVSTIYPGYIRTEMNAGAQRLPFEVDAATGARAIAAAIEREPVRAYLPRWPWMAVGFLMRRLPLRIVARMA